MRRAMRVPLLIMGAGTSALLFAWARPYDPAPWLGDLASLEAGAAAGYANLEWHVTHVVDAPALHARADSAIRHARSNGEARRALREFAAAFHDGHFAVVRPTPAWLRGLADRWNGRQEDTAPISSLRGVEACAAIGYVDEPADGSLLARVAGYRPLRTGPFESGVIEEAARPTIGVVRLGTFGIERFRAACAAAWPRVRDSLARPRCEADCQYALRVATGDELLAELRRAIDTVRAAGAMALVVDLTGNGGGSEWADVAARQFSARPLLGQSEGFVRHPHWHGALQTERRSIDSTLQDPSTDTALRPSLVAARERLDSALADAAAPCDRSAIWTAGLDAVACRQLVSGRRFTTGAVPYLDASMRGRRGADAIFWPASYHFLEGAWDGPLALLVDRRTASAAEQFVALLRDADAGLVVGERTYGAGCGMTNGGIPLTLPHSGLEVHMPDCARMRRDGSNEVAGITPDVALPWTVAMSAEERADVALSALRSPPLAPR